MRRITIQGLVIVVFCLVAVGLAFATELGLITAGENGTYYQLGLDLKKLMKPHGINLTVYTSRGSVENLIVVSQQRPDIQMGIVQSDVLAFTAAQPSNPTLTDIARNTRTVFPLFDEIVHVVGRADIGTFDDLAGKRVAIAPEGSGANLTARLLFKLAGVVPAEITPLESGEALAFVKTGDMEAMVYVAGSPVNFLRKQVTAADGLALIPITNARILESYDRTEIPAKVYDWQPTAVSTVSVKAVLVSAAFTGPECDTVGRFAQHVATGMSWLTRHGHPRWKLVNLHASLKGGGEQYDCRAKHLPTLPPREASRRVAPAERNPVADAIRSILGDP